MYNLQRKGCEKAFHIQSRDALCPVKQTLSKKCSKSQRVPQNNDKEMISFDLSQKVKNDKEEVTLLKNHNKWKGP